MLVEPLATSADRENSDMSAPVKWIVFGIGFSLFGLLFDAVTGNSVAGAFFVVGFASIAVGVLWLMATGKIAVRGKGSGKL